MVNLFALFLISFITNIGVACVSEKSLEYLNSAHLRLDSIQHVPPLASPYEKMLQKLCTPPYMQRMRHVLLNPDCLIRPALCVSFLSASLEYARFTGHVGGSAPAIIAALFMNITVPALHYVVESMHHKKAGGIFYPKPSQFFQPKTQTFIHFARLRENILNDVSKLAENHDTATYICGKTLNIYQEMREPLVITSPRQTCPITVMKFPFTHQVPPYKSTFSLLTDRLKCVHSFDFCATLLLSSTQPFLNFEGDVATSPLLPWLSLVEENTYDWMCEVKQTCRGHYTQEIFSYYKREIAKKHMLTPLRANPLSFDDFSLLHTLLKSENNNKESS